MCGKSSWSSVAPMTANRSKASFSTRSGSAWARSTLFRQTIGRRPIFSALPSTNLVCGITPSSASTSRTQPSTMPRIRSTSPPKSACPGVSMMLMRVSPAAPCHSTDVHLARMVIPRSRSWSLESMARSACASLARKMPDWASSWSTSVVLPWSTWAMMAMLRSDMELNAVSRGRGRRACRRGGAPGPARSCRRGRVFVRCNQEDPKSVRHKARKFQVFPPRSDEYMSLLWTDACAIVQCGVCSGVRRP